MGNTDEDLLKNMTVLFFYERLMDKGCARTVHDLSCQFGAPGFTKEMRKIAGGTHSGLKKFLSQYPSYFTVDGDYVYITGCEASTNETEEGEDGLRSTAGKRDYAKEAVEYFCGKLRQYGAGTAVPIKRLLGYRSHASPEIRHTSGQDVREFCDFLLKFPGDFVVNGDTVILKEYEGQERQPSMELGTVRDASVLTSRLIDFFKQCIEVKGPLLVDVLFQQVESRFPKEVWSCIFKTPQDLLKFLKEHSNLFHVESNYVNIVVSQARSKRKNSDKRKLSSININQNNNDSLSNNPLKNTEMLRDSEDVNETNILSPEDKIWVDRVLQVTRVIDDVKQSSVIVDEIMRSPNSVVSLDCEGINLGVNGQLTLIQIGTMSGHAYLFDLVICPNLVTDGGLHRLLSSKKITKVIHDCRNDSVSLYHEFNIILTKVFDTQAAHAVLQFQKTGKPVTSVKNISLNALCKKYDAPINHLKEPLQNIYRRDNGYWARRPLSQEMLLYAASDVLSLVPHIYNSMKKQIKPESKPLLDKFCDRNIFTHIKRQK